MKTDEQVAKALRTIKPFMSKVQYAVLQEGMSGEEKEFFVDKALELANTIDTMPVTYQTDGQGAAAIAHLHYFTGGSDWYITEKDMEGGVSQAFGYAIINGDLDCAEFGYISITELVEANAELDFHFAPKSVQNILGAKRC